MTAFSSSLYDAVVVHRRLRPVVHELRYRLTYALLDLDELPELSGAFRLFSYNRLNLFSLHDRDHGPGDGTPLRRHVDRIVAKAGLAGEIRRISLLCLPRFAGYVFNPLSIYYAFGSGDEPRLVIYEVSNTFGERKTYVLPVEPPASGPIRQNCAKRFYVSPFNDTRGRYDFRIAVPDERVRAGVSLSDAGGGILDAHLVGARREISDRQLAVTAWRHPALTWKVIGGIHWEALKLYLKGLRPVPRPPAPDVPVSYLPTPLELEGSPR
ncbi:DUF1365 domain-containing protein [Microbaculum marinum]|uniref:DUF1365 domain-containing protein n=1 Tax=Microbaculum marinum TaxID=1764581 RepID=A0AAW9RFJ8_9HYPH